MPLRSPLVPPRVGVGSLATPPTGYFSSTAWTNITPGGRAFPTPYPSFGVIWVHICPADNSIVYCCIDDVGLYKSTDGAKTWNSVGGTPPFASNTTASSTYLDSPFNVYSDPSNANNLYVTQGVRGSTLGFWKSTDGGVNFSIPSGFDAICGDIGVQRDVTQLAIDPSDFQHILLSTHASWTNYGIANGLLESFDGGSSWRKIFGPTASPGPWSFGTLGVHFLYNPALGIGNNTRWLVQNDTTGYWLTTNSGTSWTQVSTLGIPHGGAALTYTNSGVIYTGGLGRSFDNGSTWETVPMPVSFYSYAFGYDGTYLYASIAYTGDNTLSTDYPFWRATGNPTSSSDWTAMTPSMKDGAYNFSRGASSKLLLAACWGAGLQALQT